jgi:hypothetical protein
MAIDPKIVGGVAAELMEGIESEYGDEARITGALLIVGVDRGDNTEAVHWLPSHDLARYEAVGLLEFAKARILGVD